MMKKFISIVLTICMLFSLITVTTAAEISEDERLALLKKPQSGAVSHRKIRRPSVQIRIP